MNCDEQCAQHEHLTSSKPARDETTEHVFRYSENDLHRAEEWRPLTDTRAV
jgi:hypothetical protein